MIRTVKAFAARTPPAEIQLWNSGQNSTDYGVHIWDDRSRKEVMDRYLARGNPLLIDIEHAGTTLKNGEPAPTGGYAKLELRNGAPWLVFSWSDFARQQIESGERRFLSPEYDVDKDTGEITALYRVSLVGDPGTHSARVLATRGESMDLDVILAALRAALAAEDPAVAKESITNLLNELQKTAGSDAPSAPPSSSDAATSETPVGAESNQPDKVDPIAATAKTNKPPAPVAPAVPAPPPVVSVDTVAASAVRQIQDAQRDHLLATHGKDMDPSLRRWASAQPLAIVQGLVSAIPAKEPAIERVAATRGVAREERGLQGRDLEDVQRGFGTYRASALLAPVETPERLILPTVPPREYMANKAKAAAAVIGGK